MKSTNSSWSHVAGLVALPAILTLVVTVLRLVGELQHWGPPWVVNSHGGSDNAIIGVTWLPLLFGPYFAWKLIKSGAGPSGWGSAVALAIGSTVVFFFGSFLIDSTEMHPGIVTVTGLLITLAAAFIPGKSWRALGVTLLTYALATRIPVAIVILIAMSANGGQGLGTHFDVVHVAGWTSPWWKKFLLFGLAPEITLWIGWTVAAGSLAGTLVAAIFRFRKRQAATS
jgi:hypothetical protein